MGHNVGWIVLLGALVLAAPAGAQDAPIDDSVGPQDARAREIFQQGAAAFAEGRYEDALSAFEEAFRLSGRAELHYNIALAHDRLRQDRQALEAYERYLAQVDSVPNRAEVQRRVEILRRATTDDADDPDETGGADPAHGEPTETAAAPPPPSSGSGGPGLLPWIVLGASGAVAVGGGVLFAVGLGESASVEDAPDGAPWSDYEAAADRGGLLQTLGVIGMAAGLAGVAAGVGLLVLGGDEEASVRAHLSPRGLTIRGAF